MATEAPGIRWHSAAARWVIAATVAGYGLVLLDVTTVNIALPAIAREFDVAVAGLQWTVSAYTLALASLILLSGALADRFGRRRIFLLGIAWFALASIGCALAPTTVLLIAIRGLQGIGAALLLPCSLAIIESSFVPDDRARAVGAWSGIGAVAAAIGPLLGGWLVQTTSWRAIFWLNLPVAAAALVITWRHVPETRAPASPHAGRFDIPGAMLCVASLGLVTWASITAGAEGASIAVLAAAIGGVALLVGFGVVERAVDRPLVPPRLFRSRQFTGVNIVTVVVYGGMAGLFFLVSNYLQRAAGYSPLGAGAALAPVTLMMLGLSPRAGDLAQRIGPRYPMTLGPLVMAAGMLLFRRLDPGADYWSDVLPAAAVFGLGLSATVAPLTATALASAEDALAGIASGVNNAAARTAALLSVAILPLASGLTGTAFGDPQRFTRGFRTAMLITAGMMLAGSILAWFTISDRLRD